MECSRRKRKHQLWPQNHIVFWVCKNPHNLSLLTDGCISIEGFFFKVQHYLSKQEWKKTWQKQQRDPDISSPKTQNLAYKTLRHISQRKLSLLNDAIHGQAKVSYIKWYVFTLCFSRVYSISQFVILLVKKKLTLYIIKKQQQGA